jgi:hypothetical protein
MSRAEIIARLADLQKKYPNAFIEGEYKDVTGSGVEFLEHDPQESTAELLRVETRESRVSGDA